MSTAHVPDSDEGRRGRTPHRSRAVVLAQCERRVAREVERRTALQAECAALRLEVRRLMRLLKSSDAGRVAELRAQVDRLRSELDAWKSGRR